MAGHFDGEAQLTMLLALDHVRDLVTAAEKETYTREELLVFLTEVMDDRELFDGEIRAMYDEAAQEAEALLVDRSGL